MSIWKTFSMIKFATDFAPYCLFELEGENFDWVRTGGTNVAFFLLANFAPVKMATQNLELSL